MINWNKEMEESIERVKHKAKADSLEYEIERRKKAQELINENGGIDFKALKEGARLAELDRVVANKLYWEKEAEKQKAEQEEVNNLMSKLADKLKTDKEVEAEKEFKMKQAKVEAELQKEIYKKHNVKTDKQLEEEAAYKSMLDSLHRG